jgi:preprotein translocase subunit YajC
MQVLDGGANGGRKSQVEVVSGARHALFPRVTKTERVNGVTRYRKQFWCNENADDDVAYGVLQWLENVSNGGDRFYLKKGTQTDTQANITSPPAGAFPLFTGAGRLSAPLTGGETEVAIEMEADDFAFESGGYLHIADKIKAGQTMAAGVVAGDSVQITGGTWNKITSTTDIKYPKGIYLGGNEVLTVEPETNEEWLVIATIETADEVIGAGDGASASPALSTLANTSTGIHRAEGKLPVITTLDGSDATMTAYIRPDGTVDPVASDATAGELDMDTGEWVADIAWTSTPKNGADILATYCENPFDYSGNVVTIQLDDQVANPYAVANTVASGCVYADEVRAEIDSFETSSVSGTYNDTSYPAEPHNSGAEEDQITITMTSATVCSIAGANLGPLGSGFSIASDCTPTDPTSGQPLFTLRAAGWGGTWAAGNTITFHLHPSAQGIWLKEVVPAGTEQEPNNLIVLGWYSE